MSKKRKLDDSGSIQSLSVDLIGQCLSFLSLRQRILVAETSTQFRAAAQTFTAWQSTAEHDTLYVYNKRFLVGLINSTIPVSSVHIDCLDADDAVILALLRTARLQPQQPRLVRLEICGMESQSLHELRDHHVALRHLSVANYRRTHAHELLRCLPRLHSLSVNADDVDEEENGAEPWVLSPDLLSLSLRVTMPIYSNLPHASWGHIRHLNLELCLSHEGERSLHLGALSMCHKLTRLALSLPSQLVTHWPSLPALTQLALHLHHHSDQYGDALVAAFPNVSTFISFAHDEEPFDVRGVLSRWPLKELGIYHKTRVDPSYWSRFPQLEAVHWTPGLTIMRVLEQCSRIDTLCIYYRADGIEVGDLREEVRAISRATARRLRIRECDKAFRFTTHQTRR